MSAAGLRVAAGLAWVAATLAAQPRQQIAATPADGPALLRAYRAPRVPPARLAGSTRAATLLRAGRLYLTLHDAIALALENNIGLEINRYGPLLSDWALRRVEAGGPVRGVPNAGAQISGVNNGVGVNGSAASAGLSNTGNGERSGSAGGASIQQIGSVTPNLDPVLQNATTFSHQTQPQANTVLSQTNALVQDQRAYYTTLQQGLLSGGTIQLRDYGQYLRENAPSDALNPAWGPHADLYFRHNLLQGFGTKLNGRSIRIARMNVTGSMETFRSQVIDLVAEVSRLYWELVSAADTVGARQAAVEIARKFDEDTRDRVRIGSLAPIELPRAAAELANRAQDLRIAEAAVRQLENRFREAITRGGDGAADFALEAAQIVPLDRPLVPPTDDLPPWKEMVARALTKRPDVALSRIGAEAAAVGALGTENPLLPQLAVTALTYNRGVAGTPQASGGKVNPYFAGGNATALGQIVRRNFPSEAASLSLTAKLGNRQAQGDYGTDQLELRQGEVQRKRDGNQIAVDLSNQVIALRQARARYAIAFESRELQEQLLRAEQQKFAFGRATITGLITAQRGLVAARMAEITALATYAQARVSLDQVRGETLEQNDVALEEALVGRQVYFGTVK